ncbi:MAG TPA: hypothetical protein VF177_05460 [Anaerolineae bacterium]
MKTKKVQVELPLSFYDDLQEIAQASSWPLEEVLLQCVKAGMPPTLRKVPEAFHEELLALNRLNDRDLLRVVEDDLPATGKQGELHRKADFNILRRTYALSVLRWRGHPILDPYEALIG